MALPPLSNVFKSVDGSAIVWEDEVSGSRDMSVIAIARAEDTFPLPVNPSPEPQLEVALHFPLYFYSYKTCACITSCIFIVTLFEDLNT